MARKKIREYDSKRLLKEHIKRLANIQLTINSVQVRLPLLPMASPPARTRSQGSYPVLSHHLPQDCLTHHCISSVPFHPSGHLSH